MVTGVPHERSEAWVMVQRWLAVLAATLGTLCLIHGADLRPGSAVPELPDAVNPNIAPVGSLVRLPGIGPQRATAIVEYRRQYTAQEGGQAYRTPSDLEAVPGLGKATVQAMAPYLCFDPDPDPDSDSD